MNNYFVYVLAPQYLIVVEGGKIALYFEVLSFYAYIAGYCLLIAYE